MTEQEWLEMAYWAVYYNKDGTVTLWPGRSQEECLEKLKEVLWDPHWEARCLATTVVKRKMENFEAGYIFGHPKSLDVMSWPMKKREPKEETE